MYIVQLHLIQFVCVRSSRKDTQIHNYMCYVNKIHRNKLTSGIAQERHATDAKSFGWLCYAVLYAPVKMKSFLQYNHQVNTRATL